MNNQLLYEVIEYNKQRKIAFKKGVILEENKEFERILKARYNKISRIKKRFMYLLLRYDYLYFCTFTFDDENINKCDRTKKDIIKHCLYNFDDNIKYIINIDYGSKTEREHYHGIIATNSKLNFKNYLDLAYPFISNTKIIRLDSTSLKCVSKYMNKLSNHAVKSSTRNSRVLYNFKGYDKFDKEDARVLIFFDKIKVGLT